MKILGVDVETTGLSPQANRLTEIGAALYNTETKEVEAELDVIIKEPDVGKLPSFIIELTGITDQKIEEEGKDPLEVLTAFSQLYNEADYICAHNAPFDKSMISAFACRYWTEEQQAEMVSKHWIDTSKDLPLPKTCKHSNLTYLKGFYEIVVGGSHRAILDVRAMLQVLSKFDVDVVVGRTHAKKVLVYCYPGFEGRNAPKAAGFHYQSIHHSWNIKDKHSWSKEFVESDIDMKALKDGTLYDFGYKYEIK